MNTLKTVEDINNVISSNSNLLLVIRFGDITDPLTVIFDSLLNKIKNKVCKFVKICICEKEDVPEIARGISEPACLMLFYNCNLIEVDVGDGSKKQISIPLEEEEMVEMLVTAYKLGGKGKYKVKI